MWTRDLGILLHHAESTFYLELIQILKQLALFFLSKLTVITTLMESRFGSLQHLKTKPKFGWSYPEAQIGTWMSYDKDNQSIFPKKLINNVCKTNIKSIPKVNSLKPVFLFIKEFGKICPPMNSVADTSGKPKSRNLSVNWYDMNIRERERETDGEIQWKFMSPMLEFKFRSDGSEQFH